MTHPNTFLPNNTKRSWQKKSSFANHDGAFCRAGSRKCFVRRSATTVCAPSSVLWHDGDRLAPLLLDSADRSPDRVDSFPAQRC
ncbi:hypothetical protein MJ561_01290 [Klebsiella pneumoniae]|nr:hypothetical protein MJ561_01290 [Klebsiella pneumoniae]